MGVNEQTFMGHWDGFLVNVEIPEKSAQKIFRAADQILRAGRPAKEQPAKYAN